MKRALCLLVLLVGCPLTPVAPPEPAPSPAPCADCMPPMPPSPAPQPEPGPQPQPPTGDACERAAANMQALHCAGWRGSPGDDDVYGTPDDVPAAVVCRDTEESSEGHFALSLHPDCVAAASSCAAALRCSEAP